MLTMRLLSRWLESLDYEYRISPDCSRYQSPRSNCTNCIDHCSVDAISLENDKPVINNKSCIECGDCVASCPVQAVEGFLPKRTIKDKQFIMDGNKIPSVKELLIYYQEGIKTIVCDENHINDDWLETIEIANEVLETLGEAPFLISHDEVRSEDKKISRRELFNTWEKDLKRFSKKMAPAKWRFNHESLNLAKYYPNHQFVDISLDTEQCTLCKACQVLCRKDSLKIYESGFFINPQQCSNCSLCEDICPEGAISVKEMISPATSINHPIYKKVCSSCGDSFKTLSKENDLCILCLKKEEFSLI